MSTCYYWTAPPCGSCGRADQIIFGHSAGGWVFLWRGYRLDEESAVPQSVREFGVSLNTAKAWFNFLQAQGGTIEDEYSRVLTVDELTAIVVGKRGGLVRNSPEAMHHYGAIYPGEFNGYHDPDGDDIAFYDFG